MLIRRLGEIAASFAAGHITATTAITLAYYRGLVVSRSSMKGAMLAVNIGFDAANVEIDRAGLSDKVRVACDNAPNMVTISGDHAAIHELSLQLESQSLFMRKLRTDDKAYHSYRMGLLGQEYEDLIAAPLSKNEYTTRGSPMRMISSTTGKSTDVAQTLQASYWSKNLESPVLFSNALTQLLSTQEYHLLETGPHSILNSPIREIRESLNLTESQIPYTSFLSRTKNSVETTLEGIGTLYLHGYEVPFERINSISTSARVIHNLPSYNWNHSTSLWKEPRTSSEYRNRKFARHEILGTQSPGGDHHTRVWRNLFAAKDVSWLKDHSLGNVNVFPAAGYIAMAVEALCQILDIDSMDISTVTIRQVKFINALAFPDTSTEIELFTKAHRAQNSSMTTSNTWWHLDITSLQTSTALVHASGLVGFDPSVPIIKRHLHFRHDNLEEQAPRSWYQRLANEGLNFGPRFQSLVDIHTDKAKKQRRTLAKVDINQMQSSPITPHSKYAIHPVIIDAILQAAIIATAKGSIEGLKGLIPVSISQIHIRPIPRDIASTSRFLVVRAVAERIGFRMATTSGELTDNDGHVSAQMDNVQFTAFEDSKSSEKRDSRRQPILKVVWKPDISSLPPGECPPLAEYVERYASARPNVDKDPGLIRLASGVDLLTHKKPKFRILELNPTQASMACFLGRLHSDTVLQRFQSYTIASINEEGQLIGRELEKAPQIESEDKPMSQLAEDATFDMIIVSPVSQITICFQSIC